MLLAGIIVPATVMLPTQQSQRLLGGAASFAQAASPLSESLRDKPVVVEIYASWCGACKKVQPVLKQVQAREGDRIHLIKFDVSNSAAAKRSAKQAEKLGLGMFFSSHRTQTSLVAIFNPNTGEQVKTFRAQTSVAPYIDAISMIRDRVGG